MKIKPFTREELQRYDLVFLLVLEFAGRIFRVATRTAHLSSNDGALLFRGTLNPVDFVQEVALFAEEPPVPQVAVECQLPVDLTKEVERRHTLDRIRGSYYAWCEGRTWEQAVPLLVDGYLEEPQPGQDGKLIGTLTAAPFEERATLWPGESQRISLTTWEDPQEDALGRVYPTPIGSPGYITGRSTSTLGTWHIRPGSRAWLVDTAGTFSVPYALLIAGGPIALNTVNIVDADNTVIAATKTPELTTDLLGQVVTVVELNSTQAGSPDFERQFFVRANFGDEGWGIYGDVNRQRDSARIPMEGAGDVATWALRRSGRPVDWGALEALAPTLNQYTVGGAIDDDDRIDLYDWLQGGVLKGMPIGLSRNALGLRMHHLDPMEWKDRAQMHFIAGRHGERLEDPIVSRDLIENEIVVRWGLNRGDNTYHRTAVTVDRFSGGDEDEIPSSYVSLSRTRYGVKEAVFPLPFVHRRETAKKIALARLRLRALGWRSITYTARPEWLRFDEGTPFLLTDSDLDIEAAPCLLRAKGWSASQARLEFIVSEDPVIHRRTTA